MSAPKTLFVTSNNLTRKRWARDLFKIVLPAVEFNDLTGKGSGSIVQLRTELGKGHTLRRRYSWKRHSGR
jgi:hypothetical protein